ncbi:MAG TPA: hypothetical protein VKU00_14945 [Chthonomonadaceae bacterium]|nr:hypothetical protein [Chthonomonadaceae bacterium]
MELRAALLCDAANISEAGKVNMLGVYSVIHSYAVPFPHTIILVLIFVANPLELGQTHEVSIRIVDEDAKTVAKLESLPVLVPNNPGDIKPQVNVILTLQNMTFQKFGQYQFEILVDGERASEVLAQILPISRMMDESE